MPEEKQRKSMRTSELDKMINKLRSLDQVDGTSEYYKNNAIAYLSDLANYLDRIGVKTIKMRPEVAASSGAHKKKTQLNYRKIGGESQVNDEAIHIPARKKQQTGAQMAVKVTPEAYNALVEIYNESTLSLKQIASLLIVKAAERVVYDKE